MKKSEYYFGSFKIQANFGKADIYPTHYAYSQQETRIEEVVLRKHNCYASF